MDRKNKLALLNIQIKLIKEMLNKEKKDKKKFNFLVNFLLKRLKTVLTNIDYIYLK